MKYNLKVQNVYSEEDCKSNPNCLYVFGDNVDRMGHGGQATIRDCTNAIGIATKLTCRDCMTDSNYAWNQGIINTDIKAIQTKYNFPGYNTLVLPRNGVGTGLANMQQRCPKTFIYLCTRLMEEFSYNNVFNLVCNNG